MEAAEKGHVELMKYVIRRGADVNAVSTIDRCVLYYAIMSRSTHAVRVLMDAGAAIRKYDGSNCILHVAVGKDYWK